MWNEAKPSIIKLSAHLLIFFYAAMCVAAMLVVTYGLMMLCDLLFVNYEIYVKLPALLERYSYPCISYISLQKSPCNRYRV